MPSSRPSIRLDFGSARNLLDHAVDKLHLSRRFTNDDERVAMLLARYQKLVGE